MNKKRKFKDPVVCYNDKDGRCISHYPPDDEEWLDNKINEDSPFKSKKCLGCKYTAKEEMERYEKLTDYFFKLNMPSNDEEYILNLTTLLNDLIYQSWEHTCHSCNSNKLNKISSIKKECKELSAKIKELEPQIENLYKKPTFLEALRVLFMSNRHNFTYFNENGGTNLMGIALACDAVAEMDSGKDSTKLRYKARENMFAYLMIIYKLISGKDPVPEIKFILPDTYSETPFYIIIMDIFNMLEIDIPSEKTAKEYIHRFPFNDNDEFEAGFIQRRYEKLFGEHPNKKKFLKKYKQIQQGNSTYKI